MMAYHLKHIHIEASLSFVVLYDNYKCVCVYASVDNEITNNEIRLSNANTEVCIIAKRELTTRYMSHIKHIAFAFHILQNSFFLLLLLAIIVAVAAIAVAAFICLLLLWKTLFDHIVL